MKEWLSIRPIECTTLPTLNAQFKFDSKGRLRNRRFENYCLAPTDGQFRNNAQIQLVHCKLDKISWLVSDDGTLTVSGSDLGLSIAQPSVNDGNFPFLYDVKQNQFYQKWKLISTGD